VVIDGNGEGFLRIALADDVAIKKLADLMWLGQLIKQADLAALGEFFLDDLVAEVDAFVTDVDPWTGDQLLDLLLTLSAERAFQQVAALSDTRHTASSLCPIFWARSLGWRPIVWLVSHPSLTQP
jgi:hypothetical protein